MTGTIVNEFRILGKGHLLEFTATCNTDTHIPAASSGTHAHTCMNQHKCCAVTVKCTHTYITCTCTCTCTWKLLDLHKSKQGNTTNLNISFSMENEKELLRWDSNPQCTLNKADTLPTELPRRLGRNKAIQGKGNQSN